MHGRRCADQVEVPDLRVGQHLRGGENRRAGHAGQGQPPRPFVPRGRGDGGPDSVVDLLDVREPAVEGPQVVALGQIGPADGGA